MTVEVPGPRWGKDGAPIVLPHVLVVEGRGEDADAWIEHPDGCPRYCRWWPGPREVDDDVEEYDCYVAWETDYCGLESIIGCVDGRRVEGVDGWRNLLPGRYIIEPWYTPPGWAGSQPIDADGGLHLAGRETPRWWDALRRSALADRVFITDQLVGVRLPWIGYVALKGPKHRPLFSERNRFGCSVWTLYGGWRIVRRP